MSQAIKKTPLPSPEELPTVVAKVHGNHVDELKKDDLVWHAVYEKILRLTVVFIQVEEASNDSDKALFEKSINIYLTNKGLKVEGTKYYADASLLKEYIKQT